MKITTAAILMGITFSACGSSFGSKEACDTAFSTQDVKFNQVQKQITTVTQLKALMGEPAVIYDTKDAGIKEYAFYVYAQGKPSDFCGQYRIFVSDVVLATQYYKSYINR